MYDIGRVQGDFQIYGTRCWGTSVYHHCIGKERLNPLRRYMVKTTRKRNDNQRAIHKITNMTLHVFSKQSTHSPPDFNLKLKKIAQDIRSIDQRATEGKLPYDIVKDQSCLKKNTPKRKVHTTQPTIVPENPTWSSTAEFFANRK